MTVPFIMALGVGLSASRSDKNGMNDSFGLIALASVGPILMVLLLGTFYHPTEAAYELVQITPKSIRMRKKVLGTEARKKLEVRKKQG
jgi:hypothetical protein